VNGKQLKTTEILLGLAKDVESGDTKISTYLSLILWARRKDPKNPRLKYYAALDDTYRGLNETTILKSFKQEFEKEFAIIAKELSEIVIAQHELDL